MEPDNKSKIEYSGQEYIEPIYSKPDNKLKIEHWLINHSHGKINDEKQAGIVLFGLVIFIFIIIMFLLLSQVSSYKPPTSSFRNHNASNL
jgi:hypothetical protein